MFKDAALVLYTRLDLGRLVM